MELINQWYLRKFSSIPIPAQRYNKTLFDTNIQCLQQFLKPSLYWKAAECHNQILSDGQLFEEEASTKKNDIQFFISFRDDNYWKIRDSFYISFCSRMCKVWLFWPVQSYFLYFVDVSMTDVLAPVWDRQCKVYINDIPRKFTIR